ncbi:MAG: TVP38/TMEM64 family protein [Cyclobacteriaceae bacterium]
MPTQKISKKSGEQESQQSQSRLIFIISGSILLALVLCYFFVSDFKEFINESVRVLSSDDEQQVENWVSNFGFWGPVFIIGAMTAQMFLIIIPSVVLMVVSTLAYGPWWGSLISYIAVVLAATIAYFIGVHANNAFVDKLIGEKNEKKVEKYIQKYGAWAIVLFRLSPFLSNDAISFVAGIGHMRFVKFITATSVGIIPLIAMIAFLGKETDRLQTGMIWISVATLVGFAVYYLIKRKRKKQ